MMLSISLYSQTDRFCGYTFVPEDYDLEQQKEDWLNTQNDSLNIAVKSKLWEKIVVYNAETEYGKAALEQYDSLKAALHKEILGEWTLEWGGSDWGGDRDTSIQMLIDTQRVEFITNNTDTILDYTICVKEKGSFDYETGTFTFARVNLEIKFNKTVWILDIEESVSNRYASIAIRNKKDKIFLTLLEFGPVCGNQELVFSKRRGVE